MAFGAKKFINYHKICNKKSGEPKYKSEMLVYQIARFMYIFGLANAHTSAHTRNKLYWLMLLNAHLFTFNILK